MKMNPNFAIGDIVHFNQYYFNDTGTTNGNRFALVILPDDIVELDGQSYCCVITSQSPRYKKLSMKLLTSEYACFSLDSYACFDRRDYQAHSDLSSPNAKEKLKQIHILPAFRKLKNALFSADNNFMRGVLIREWKKVVLGNP